MGIITAALREKGYYVSQEDLILKNKELKNEFSFYLYDYWKYIPKILKTGKGNRELDNMIEVVFNTLSFKDYDTIGFSILSFGHFLTAIMLAKKIRHVSKVPIIFGGAFITLYGKLYPEVFNYIDYMVIGDGRQSFIKILDCLQGNEENIETISNIAYKKLRRLITSEFVNYPLEDVPLPDFSGLPLDLYRHPLTGRLVLPYEITRGCVYKCGFCARSPMKETFEAKSHIKVVRDLKEMKEKYHMDAVMLCDLNPASSYKYFDGLLDYIIGQNINITWRTQIDVRKINPDLIAKIRKSGCDGLMYGIETGSADVLEAVGKDQGIMQAEQALALTKSAGIQVTAFFMVGSPYEKEQDVTATVNFIQRNKKNIDFGVVRKFTVVAQSFMCQNPLHYGICNLKAKNSRYMFDFDEVHGMRWRKKRVEQERAKHRIQKAIIDLSA